MINGSTIRLIAWREIRDLLRDRRTVMLILVLPALLYPLFGLAGFLFAQSLTGQNSRVGIVGDLAGIDPPLIRDEHFDVSFVKKDALDEVKRLSIVHGVSEAETALNARQVDVALVVPAGFASALRNGNPTSLEVLDRDGDEKSKLAAKRLNMLLTAWAAKLREAKFAKAGLPKDFEKVFELKDSQSKKPAGKKAADELRDTFVKAFPFILMMWLVAGAIQPAVDLTAGEKERGTMETLLISPAQRSEIVLGKFFAVFAFTFASVIWNVLWLLGGAIFLEQLIGFPILNPWGLIGCLALGVPLAMFFSALSIALGVFARSTKEGQYYLMPLIMVTMPLAFWSMMPGAELTIGRAFIPVTGPMLMQQKFLNAGADPIPWEMLAPVLGCLVVSIAVALWLAVVQFRSESVLFREASTERKSRLLSMLRRKA